MRGLYVPHYDRRAGGWVVIPPTGKGRVFFVGGIVLPPLMAAPQAMLAAGKLNAWAGLR